MSDESGMIVSSVVAARGPRAGSRAAGFAVLAALVCLGAGCSNDARIYVDNAGDEPMVVTVDGKPMATVAPGQYEMFTCPPGERQFHVRVGDEVLFDGVKKLEEPKVVGMGRRYFFNPDNRNRYRTYTVEYGSSLFGDLFDTSEEEPPPGDRDEAIRRAYRDTIELAELVPADPWFEIVNIQHVLTREPDEVVTRSSSEKRRVLARVNPRDYEFIAQARKNKNPTEEDLIALVQVVSRVLETGP